MHRGFMIRLHDYYGIATKDRAINWLMTADLAITANCGERPPGHRMNRWVAEWGKSPLRFIRRVR